MLDMATDDRILFYINTSRYSYVYYWSYSSSGNTDDGSLGSLESYPQRGISSYDEYLQTTEGCLERRVG